MISLLTDVVLVAALVFTSWRTGVMYRELRKLRGENSVFRQTLASADSAINKAALAVVTLKSDGLATICALEERTIEARRQADRLDHAIRAADLRFALVEHEERSAA